MRLIDDRKRRVAVILSVVGVTFLALLMIRGVKEGLALDVHVLMVHIWTSAPPWALSQMCD